MTTPTPTGDFNSQAYWDGCYRAEHTWTPLADDEKTLLASQVPPAGRVLEIGCGRGELAGHLAECGYAIDAVDLSPIALSRAQKVEGVQYVHGDIEQPLRLPHPDYDVIVARLVWPFLQDRSRVVHRVRRLLRPGGILCVLTPRPADLPESKQYVTLTKQELEELARDFTEVRHEQLTHLDALLLRHPHATYAPVREKDEAPAPLGCVGVAVVVLNSVGQVLLGRSTRSALWEAPGGKPQEGESAEETAVRELAEETGLHASARQALVRAWVLDTSHQRPRWTAVVQVPLATRPQPHAAQPHLVSRWEWCEPADLPHQSPGLFTPTAHALAACYPGLWPTGALPAAHTYPQPVPRKTGLDTGEARRLRRQMVDTLTAEGWFDRSNVAVCGAMARVPRHPFVEGAGVEEVYAAADGGTPTLRDANAQVSSSISAPWIQARMLQDGGVRSGAHVAEIGSGGYNAALAQQIVGPSGSVATMDIDPRVTERAARHLGETGYGQVRVALGDGALGLPDSLVPEDGFDALLVTATAPNVPAAWWEQLRPGGRLVLPLRLHGYTWTLPFTRTRTALVSSALQVSGFVDLSGGLEQQDARWSLCEGAVLVRFPEPATAQDLNVPALEAALRQARHERESGVVLDGDVPFDRLLLYLATHSRGFCRIAIGETDLDIAPHRGWEAAACTDGDSLARLTVRRVGERADGIRQHEFLVHAYGPKADALADQMTHHLHTWDHHHRHQDPTVTLYPRSLYPEAPRDAHELLAKAHTWTHVHWPTHPSAGRRAIALSGPRGREG